MKKMNSKKTIRDLFRIGFRNETEVRNALNDLYSKFFDEFFKILKAFMVVAALKFAAGGETWTFTGVLAIVGQVALFLKVLSVFNGLHEESIFDVTVYNNESRGKLSSRIHLFTTTFVVIFGALAISFSVDLLVDQFVETISAEQTNG